MSSARIDEYSVPQMNGRAPKSPDTGSHVEVRQKLKPNWRIESIDSIHEHDADRDDGAHEQKRERPGRQPKAQVARAASDAGS